jgi:hypothetical protein
VGLPPPWLPTALRYVVAGLAVNTAHYVRVGVAPPALPAEVTAVLPRTVPVVFSAVGEPGAGCSCASARAGLPCAAAPSDAAAEYTPRRPVIGKAAFACGGGLHATVVVGASREEWPCGVSRSDRACVLLPQNP